MSQTPESISLAAKRNSRKSHRKSRNGCEDCKRRRIKCDEQRPACSNCVKHSTRCSFLRSLLPAQTNPAASPQNEPHLGPVSPPVSASPYSTETIGSPGTFQSQTEFNIPGRSSHPTLNVADLELLHNYDTATCYTLATIPSLQTFCRLNVPRMAFSHPFLLHGMLAISALHLAHFKKDLRPHYLGQAQYHYQTGLRIVTPMLAEIDDSNCSALYMFSTLCTTFTLGMGPKPGDYLFFGEHGLAEGLVLFRGMKAIMESHPEILEKSELSPLFNVSIRQVLQPSSNNQHLAALRELIMEASSDDENLPVYLKALDLLSKSFPASSPASSRTPQASPQNAFVWLYRISDEYLALLQSRQQVALVIFAYFCVLLNDLSSFWSMKGWVDHLLSEIYRSLDEEHRVWMNWPMEEIGWIPSS